MKIFHFRSKIIDYEKTKIVKSHSHDRFLKLYETSFEYQKKKKQNRLSYLYFVLKYDKIQSFFI